ncbi:MULTISPECIES: hypothetical protein [Maricaulis]|uniref:Uncharacterized protein n=1 Tax=Maricaulis maris TaxID=74318 RepID=A0A495DCL0_9PROT|nr:MULTISPECIES: hypothetical protein [Maricaulis]RKR00051.1 hypothetical protein C7435_1249 [Maricaulis maris]
MTEPSSFEREIADYAITQSHKHESESANAKKEQGRYLVAGAAGGIALLVGQFDTAADTQRLLIASALIFYAASLYCSFNTLRAVWVEESENAVAWKKWDVAARTVVFEQIQQKGAVSRMLELPPTPRNKTRQFDRWNWWAVTFLVQGAIWSLFFLGSHFEWWPWLGQHAIESAPVGGEILPPEASCTSGKSPPANCGSESSAQTL